METAISELPLTLFTTLVLIGTGAFVLQAFAYALAPATADEQPAQKGLDIASFVPMALVIVGFACAFMHLASPVHATFAFAGIGSSPLSNEIAVGSLFVLAAIVYCILASAGKLAGTARKAFAIVLGVLGLVFALFTGFAYYVETIISWASVYTIVEALGLSLFAGGVLGALLVQKTGGSNLAEADALRVVELVLVVGGAVLGLGALALHVSMVSGFQTALVMGSAVTGAAMGAFVAALVCGVLSVICACIGLVKGAQWALPLACVLAVVAVFAARMMFYAMQMSVAL